MDRLLLATRNPAKLAYYRSVLEECKPLILGLHEVDVRGTPAESGRTAEENAEIKASFYSAAAGLAAFSEDEAFYADFLPSNLQPGTHVRRIDGHEAVDDLELLDHWNAILERIPLAARTGHWHIACCLALPDRSRWTRAIDYPIRFFTPRSAILVPGWPLSSLQGPAEFDRPWSELSDVDRQSARIGMKHSAIELLSLAGSTARSQQNI